MLQVVIVLLQQHWGREDLVEDALGCLWNLAIPAAHKAELMLHLGDCLLPILAAYTTSANGGCES